MMFTQCIGLPQKSTLIKKLTTTPINQSINNEESVDYSPAYTLQDNIACLQKAQRSMLHEIIGILSKYSKELKQCQDKWTRKYADQQIHITSFKNLWKLFSASIIAIDDYIDQINESIEDLKDARKSIPTPNEHDFLKFKIIQARSDIDKLTHELNQLEEDKNKFEKIKNRSTNSTNRFKFQGRSDINQSLARTETLIEQKKRSLEKQKKLFQEKQIELFKESKTNEIQRCKILKEQLQVFVQSLNIESNEFKQKFKNCDLEKDLQRWETNCFQKISNNQTDE